MNGEDGYFDEPVAARYDESYPEMFSPERVDPVVDLLVELAGDGRALELAIGTGRIARSAGAAWRAGARDRALAGDGRAAAREARAPRRSASRSATSRAPKVDGTFTVAYLVFNTIQNVLTQAEQVATFRNAAAHLEPGGCFVVEVMVPDLQRLPPGETSRPFNLSADHVGLDEYDVANQGLRSHHFSLRDGSWQYLTIPFRYVWPSELDLMAELAGMRLRDRWADWNREPFTSESRKHVSVWEKPR